jgi:hypothetical protein
VRRPGRQPGRVGHAHHADGAVHDDRLCRHALQRWFVSSTRVRCARHCSTRWAPWGRVSRAARAISSQRDSRLAALRADADPLRGHALFPAGRRANRVCPEALRRPRWLHRVATSGPSLSHRQKSRSLAKHERRARRHRARCRVISAEAEHRARLFARGNWAPAAGSRSGRSASIRAPRTHPRAAERKTARMPCKVVDPSTNRPDRSILEALTAPWPRCGRIGCAASPTTTTGPAPRRA